MCSPSNPPIGTTKKSPYYQNGLFHGWIRFSAEKPFRGSGVPPAPHSLPLPFESSYRNHKKIPVLSYEDFFVVVEGGFEPPKSVTTDLQSAPFGRSGTLPGAGDGTRTRNLLITNQLLCQLSYTSIFSLSPPVTRIL